jgi:RNA polymerase sigma factor (TIGR02999 family)
MPESGLGNITRILNRLSDKGSSKAEATNRLFEVVYPELGRLAGAMMRDERPDHTLAPAALVNEAYLRLVGDADIEWQNRAHFFGIAATAMRRILVDHARRRSAAKRGGGWERVALNSRLGGSGIPDVEVLDLDRALTQLAEMDERAGRVVELRVFAGMKTREIARILDVSERTVDSDWRAAKLWLKKKLSEGPRG